MFKSFIAILKWWAVGANFQMLVLTGNRCFKRNFFGLKAESHSRWVLHPVIFLMVSLSPTHICLLCSSDFFFFWYITGIHNHIHMGAGPPPQFNRMEEMVQKGKKGRWRMGRGLDVIAYSLFQPR